ncbi:class I SAM-dependent methyltransferase [Streptantibioticus parmotrematis]|uniref:class I SAM-dependent methyltransferase n=1 Tax=Streptantibioticus parmotrematis TaxID=2873249 RepID=UPI0033D9DEFD
MVNRSSAQRALSVGDLDFDAAYRGKPMTADSELSLGAVPWDIGGPQPVLVELEESGGFEGHVLDVGCGTGDNAVFLAERGHRVTGVDGSPHAIAQARQRAGEAGADVEFLVGDATRLDDVPHPFDTVLSSALYHCLPEETRDDHIAALHRVCRPGARMHLFTFGVDLPDSYPMPTHIDQRELRLRLGESWTIDHIEPVRYATSFTPDALREVSTRLLDLAGGDSERARRVDHQVDTAGRIALRMWYVRAVRT